GATAAERGLRAAETAAREALHDLRARLTRESEVLLARARELWQTVHREARKADKRRESSGALREEIAAVEGQLDALAAAADRAPRRRRSRRRRGACPTRPRRSRSICVAWTSTRRSAPWTRGSIAACSRGSPRSASSTASAAACSGARWIATCAGTRRWCRA